MIEDARFKTYGCGSAIASSSLVTEWVKGKTLDEASTIKNTQIAEELALPPVKIHCSILAEDAIKAAVADYTQEVRRGRGRGREEGGGLDGGHPDRIARRDHVPRYLAERGKGVGVRLGVKTTGCSGLAYKLEFADEVRRKTTSSRATACGSSSIRRASPTSTAPSSTSCARA